MIVLYLFVAPLIIRLKITRQTTKFQLPISPEEKLANCCLHLL